MIIYITAAAKQDRTCVYVCVLHVHVNGKKRLRGKIAANRLLTNGLFCSILTFPFLHSSALG